MKTYWKNKWLEALRSGEYPQTQGALNRQGADLDWDADQKIGFCCLGVLTDLMVKEETRGLEWTSSDLLEGIDDEGESGTDSMNNNYIETDECPWQVREEAELDGSAISTLINMNDGTKLERPDPEEPDRVYRVLPCSFAEIADYIEDHL